MDRTEWLQNKECVLCASTVLLRAVHPDPDFISSRVWALSEPKRSEELSRCAVACATCKPQLKTEPERYGCGTEGSYRRGCRCNSCCNAVREIWQQKNAKKDPVAKRAYQLARHQARRAGWFADKECVHCGGRQNLQLHHVDPKEKDSHRIWSWSEERFQNEAAKCIVLCDPCHRELHAAARRYPCGTDARYQRGCRCDACRAAHTEVNRKYR